MAINLTKITQYANDPKWREIPRPYQGAGEIMDNEGKPLFGIYLTTHRDVITEIGYAATKECPEMLAACAAILCEKAAHKAVISAHLLGPAEIMPVFCEEGEPEDMLYYYAALATLAMRNAVSSYADYRKADLEQWKAQQAETEAAESAE